MRWRQGWLVVALMASACMPMDATTSRPDAPGYRAVAEPAPSEADRIAGFYDRLLTLKGGELAAELEQVRGSFEKDKSELNRLQLALLLSLPGSGFRDDSAALALLNPFVKDRGREASALRPIAMLLHSELIELKRADEALQQQSAKLKEEQRRAEGLQQKLEAIRDMEMKMIEREQNLPKKK